MSLPSERQFSSLELSAIIVELCGLCGVCPIYVVVVTDMSSPSERQFSSLELSAIIVVRCVWCVSYICGWYYRHVAPL